MATAVTFVPGHEDPARPGTQTGWAALARAGGTIVLYMGVKTLPRISAALIAGGMSPDTPAASIQWGTHARQRIVTATVSSLADAIAREGLSAPVITIIGDVVSLRDEIAWFDKRPLFGKRIVVTRASAQATGLRDALAELGANVIELPTMRIEPVDGAALRASIEWPAEFDWVVFTSQNARLVWGACVPGRGARAFAKANSRVWAVTGDACSRAVSRLTSCRSDSWPRVYSRR